MVIVIELKGPVFTGVAIVNVDFDTTTKTIYMFDRHVMIFAGIFVIELNIVPRPDSVPLFDLHRRARIGVSSIPSVSGGRPQ